MEFSEEGESVAPEGDSLTKAGMDVTSGKGVVAGVRAVKRRRPLWRYLATFASAVVGVVGAVTGVISVIPFFTGDTSGIPSLIASADRASDGVREFVVPIESLDGSFPKSDSDCAADQLAWLQRNGTEIHSRWVITLRNTAKEGAMLTVTDFTGVGTLAADRPTTAVRIVCDASGRGSQVRAARLVLDTTGQTASYDQSATSSPGAAGVPVTWNLAPGESGSIRVDLYTAAEFTGNLGATVLSGKDEESLLIDGSDIDLPAQWHAGREYMLATSGGLRCQSERGGQAIPCTDLPDGALETFVP